MEPHKPFDELKIDLNKKKEAIEQMIASLEKMRNTLKSQMGQFTVTDISETEINIKFATKADKEIFLKSTK